MLHRCDNRTCTNPDHLFLGTNGDNIRDMHSKGRGLIGESHPTVRLTEEMVLDMRARYSQPFIPGYVRSYKLIGEEFGISPTNVKAILLGRTWKHLLPKTENS